MKRKLGDITFRPDGNHSWNTTNSKGNSHGNLTDTDKLWLADELVNFILFDNTLKKGK